MPPRVRLTALLGILIGLALLTGMGGAPTEAPTKIPQPSQNHRVALTDLSGVRVELSSFSLDGLTVVSGKLGKGLASVPFTRIKSLRLEKNGQQLLCRVMLKDGGKVSLEASPGQEASGAADFGYYAIPLKEVTRIEFFGSVPPETR